MKETRKRKIALFVLFTMFLSVCAVFSISAEEDPNPSGDYLKYTVAVNKPDGELLSYSFDTLLLTDYVIQEGDMLEYDVKSFIDEGGWGAIDGEIEEVGTIRDTPGMTDQNSVGVHTGRDLSEYVYDQWFHRVINLAIPEGEGEKPTVGKKLLEIQLAMHPESDELTYNGTVFYDNIVITNNGAEKYVIFKNADNLVLENIKEHHAKDAKGTIEILTFSDEEEAQITADIQAVKEAAVQASIEASERKESQDASRAEEQASRQASMEQASIDAENNATDTTESANNENTTQSNDSSTDDKGTINMALIIGVIVGVVVIVVVIVVIVVMNGKKKK